MNYSISTIYFQSDNLRFYDIHARYEKIKMEIVIEKVMSFYTLLSHPFRTLSAISRSSDL